MSVTDRDAEAIVVLLEALFDLGQPADRHPVRTEHRLREAALHLAFRAYLQKKDGVPLGLLERAPLRVKL